MKRNSVTLFDEDKQLLNEVINVRKDYDSISAAIRHAIRKTYGKMGISEVRA